MENGNCLVGNNIKVAKLHSISSTLDVQGTAPYSTIRLRYLPMSHDLKEGIGGIIFQKELQNSPK